jgi:hypothetical protein
VAEPEAGFTGAFRARVVAAPVVAALVVATRVVAARPFPAVAGAARCRRAAGDRAGSPSRPAAATRLDVGAAGVPPPSACSIVSMRASSGRTM